MGGTFIANYSLKYGFMGLKIYCRSACDTVSWSRITSVRCHVNTVLNSDLSGTFSVEGCGFILAF